MDRSEYQRDPARNDPEIINNMLIDSRNEMEIIGPDKGARLSVYTDDIEELGMEAMIDISNRILVYELKVPLSREEQSLYAISSEPGGKIGVGFKVGKMEMGEFRGRGMGGPPGGMSRPPGSMGRSPGGMGRRPSFDSLDLWTKVQLATESPEPQEGG
jgi:hypothetical protein